MVILKLIIFSQLMRASSLIEIPTAFYPDADFFAQAVVSASFAPNDIEQDIKLNFYFNKRWAVGLNIFTFSDYSLDISYLAMPELRSLPGLSVGFRNVTYKKYINAGGGGNEPTTGFVDERYEGRNPEFFSFYTVMSKHLNPNFAVHFGVGRGEFIGYGPRSKFLNIDIFSSSKHQYFTFGAFLGFEYSYSIAKFAVEIDGRDLNVGLSFDFKKWRIMLAGLKLEHAIFKNERLDSRIAAGFEINSTLFQPTAKPVEVAFLISNKEDKKPVKGAVIKFLKTGIPGLVTNTRGVAKAQIMPGRYMISITHPQFKALRVKVNVKKDKPLKVKIALKPKVSKKAISERKIREGDALFKAGKLLEAKKAYQEALNIYPLSKRAKKRLLNVERAIRNKTLEYKAKAKYYEKKGDYKTAISYWNEVLKISPDDPEAPTKIAELQKKATAPPKPKKKKVVKKPSKPKPKKPTKAQIESTLNKAIQAFNAGNYKEAKRLLQQVLKWDPGNSRAKDYLRRTEARLKLLGE